MIFQKSSYKNRPGYYLGTKIPWVTILLNESKHNILALPTNSVTKVVLFLLQKNLTNQVNKLVTKMVFVFVQHPLQKNGMNKLFCLKLKNWVNIMSMMNKQQIIPEHKTLWGISIINNYTWDVISVLDCQELPNIWLKKHWSFLVLFLK